MKNCSDCQHCITYRNEVSCSVERWDGKTFPDTGKLSFINRIRYYLTPERKKQSRTAKVLISKAVNCPDFVDFK